MLLTFSQLTRDLLLRDKLFPQTSLLHFKLAFKRSVLNSFLLGNFVVY